MTPVNLMLIEHGLERVFFQCAAAFHARGFAAGKGYTAFQHFFVFTDDQLQSPVFAEFVAILDHRRNLVCGVDMHERERHVTEKRFARQPQQHGRVLTDAPQHREVFKFVECLAHDVNALILQL